MSDGSTPSNYSRAEIPKLIAQVMRLTQAVENAYRLLKNHKDALSEILERLSEVEKAAGIERKAPELLQVEGEKAADLVELAQAQEEEAKKKEAHQQLLEEQAALHQQEMLIQAKRAELQRRMSGGA